MVVDNEPSSLVEMPDEMPGLSRAIKRNGVRKPKRVKKCRHCNRMHNSGEVDCFAYLDFKTMFPDEDCFVSKLVIDDYDLAYFATHNLKWAELQPEFKVRFKYGEDVYPGSCLNPWGAYSDSENARWLFSDQDLIDPSARLQRWMFHEFEEHISSYIERFFQNLKLGTNNFRHVSGVEEYSISYQDENLEYVFRLHPEASRADASRVDPDDSVWVSELQSTGSIRRLCRVTDDLPTAEAFLTSLKAIEVYGHQ